MSRSSPRSEADRRRPSGRRRGQTEPTAALAAVFAVVLGLSAYAVVFAGAVPGPTDRSLAPPTLDRAHEAVVTGGVAVPDRLPAARAAGPDGYSVNATLRAAGRTWGAGPAPPTAGSVDRASRPVAVRLGPGRVRAGTLRAVVWS